MPDINEILFPPKPTEQSFNNNPTEDGINPNQLKSGEYSGIYPTGKSIRQMKQSELDDIVHQWRKTKNQ